MRRGRATLEVFGMSFLDMISCGLGGVLVLMLIMASLAETGGGRRVAVASPSDDAMPEPSAFFHLGVTCSGKIDPQFTLDVVEEDTTAIEPKAERLEIRKRRDPERATLSVLQRGWADGCLRIELGNPTYTDPLLEPLREATERYTHRPDPGWYDEQVGKELLALIGELATSRRKDAWDEQVERLRSKLAECTHKTEKAEVVAAFETVAGAWGTRQGQIASAPGCELQLTTTIDVQVDDALPLGLTQSCVVAAGGDYSLLATCDASCGAAP